VRASVLEQGPSRVGGTVGEVIRRIDRENLAEATALERMVAIARPTGDPLGRAAAFAVRFDPVRVIALRLFAALGTALVPRPGAATVAELGADTVERDAKALCEAATVLADLSVPPGLEAVAALAREAADRRGTEDIVRALVDYHRREQRSWIVAEGRNRYRLGRHGPFDPPAEDFNGYTLGRAYQLLDDLRTPA
jgi:hypothetical protein